MTVNFIARYDPALVAKVTGAVDMLYADGASAAEDRPPHVLAASGLSAFREHLAVIQDDANWLALIDAQQRVSAVPLPPGPGGQRVFTESRGNVGDKQDFEACITVEGAVGPELVAFASCSEPTRVSILRVRERSQAADNQGFAAEFVKADRFYAMLRSQTEFSGAGLNIEGAVTLDAERIVLFQRGNAKPTADLPPTDATGEISWAELRAYLDDPEHVAVPTLRNIRRYDLGRLGGVRLTFSDAEHLGQGHMLYSASAEDPASGEVAGSILGLLEPSGEARWTRLADQDGSAFRGKIEGLTSDIHDPRKVHFVIDDDDDSVPSRIYQAALNDAFFAWRDPAG
jgi:hypothetical protein